MASSPSAKVSWTGVTVKDNVLLVSPAERVNNVAWPGMVKSVCMVAVGLNPLVT